MKQKTKLLLVEDDKNLGIILHDYLEAKGFDTDLAVNGEEGEHLFLKNNYDVCVLDIMMPKKDGFTLAKDIRNSNKTIPLLFLTAKSLSEDAVKGLKIGADDYITKPFNMEELLARINAVLRRINLTNEDNKQLKSKYYSFGKFTYFPNELTLEFEGYKEKLSPKESKLLHLFLKKPTEVIDRTTALKVAWDDDNYFNSRSMDVYIAKLRKRLKRDESVELLTLHGEGFRLNF